jgi:aminoglycoside phosphotransferase (APT) family kinase protein
MEPKNSLPPQTAQWVQDSLGTDAEILSQEVLAGATSSTLHRIRARKQGREFSVVLRRFTLKEWLEEEPDLAAHEASALRTAARTGIPVPELIAFDEGRVCDVPAVLMTYLPGKVELKPNDLDGWLNGLADALVLIHQIKADDHLWDYYPWFDMDTLKAPAWSKHPDLWPQAFEIVGGPWPVYRPVFIHRDYHPTNVLWQDSKVSGVVDWVNACLGPAGIDLAHCRWNLVNIYGVEAADKFLGHYIASTGYKYQPFWDLLNLMEFIPDSPEMYKPWLEFGLDAIPPETLIERFDQYFVGVMARL